jgi:hypothetical protein
MQIVLWQPPGDFVRGVVKEITERKAASKENRMDDESPEQSALRLVCRSQLCCSIA